MSAYRFIDALRGTAIIPPPVEFGFTSIRQVCRDVMKRHGISHDDFYSKSRKRPVAWARQEAMAIAHDAGKSLPMIGRHFGMDHTSILHGVRAHKARSGAK